MIVRRLRIGAVLSIGLVLAPPVVAQIIQPLPEEWLTLIDHAEFDELAERLGQRADPQALGALALAKARIAARTRDDADFSAASAAFDRWTATLLEAWPGMEPEVQAAERAAARVRHAALIVNEWSAAALDRYTLTGGRSTDEFPLAERLARADDLLAAALADLHPLLEAQRGGRRETEDRLMTLGLFERLPALAADARFQRGWTLARRLQVDPPEAERRADFQRIAERCLLDVLEVGVDGDAAARCQLALALIYADAARWTDAARSFNAARELTQDSRLLAEIRCRQAVIALHREQFEEARALLAGLMDVDPARLPEEDAGLRFYVNWSHLLLGDGLLREAAAASRDARERAMPTLERHAARTRARAFAEMLRLAGRGGAWPELVRLYVRPYLESEHADHALDENASTAEVIFTAMEALDAGRADVAAERIEQALRADPPDPLARGEALFRLAQARLALEATSDALDAFERLVREIPEHSRASTALTHAYQIRAHQAEQSRRPEDYRALARLLRTLLERFPTHERRLDAAWWLPAALQAAGDLEDAASAFAAVPMESPHWEEAQWRRMLCRHEIWRRAAEASDARESEALLATLRQYTADALRRAAATDNEILSQRAAEALLLAAEVEAAPPLRRHTAALDTLREAARHATSDELARRVARARLEMLVTLERWDEVRRSLEQLGSLEHSDDLARLLPLTSALLTRISRMSEDDQLAAAAELARMVAPLAERALTEPRAAQLAPARRQALEFGVAQCFWLAGRLEPAEALTRELALAGPTNAAYLRLRAQVLQALYERETGHANERAVSPSSEAVARRLAEARDAWAALCRPELRAAAPPRYWEARYRYLSLLLAEGRREDVRRAIEQERLWFPDLGGPPWEAKLLELIARTSD